MGFKLSCLSLNWWLFSCLLSLFVTQIRPSQEEKEKNKKVLKKSSAIQKL